MHLSFLAVNENANENEIPFSAENESHCVYITELVTVQLRTQHFRPDANDIFGTKTKKNKTKRKIHFRPKTK